MGMTSWHEGVVGCRGFSAYSVFTTPNADWVPQFAVAHQEIVTHTDGRWGAHEYSRWPQEFSRDMFHTHCIPRQPGRDGPSEILFRTFSVGDWKPVKSNVPDVGRLDAETQTALLDEVRRTVTRYSLCTRRDGWSKTGDILVACLLHTCDRLRLLPATCQLTVCLAAHVQRLALELWGLMMWLNVVFERVSSKKDHRAHTLDVLGAHTSDPSVAAMLHAAGIPVWFQQPLSEQLTVQKRLASTPLPLEFSRQPCQPRLLLAKRDLSGALNLPGEWQRAMGAVVRRDLCARQLPDMIEAETRGDVRPAKRLREGAVMVGEDSSSIGGPRPVFLVKPAKEVRTLAHQLPLPPPRRPSSSSRRTQKKNAKKASTVASPAHHPGSSINPSRQYYSSQTVVMSLIWSRALQQMSPLPQPRASVQYYYPPPWMIDRLDGFENSDEKTPRYLHQLCHIRNFCRVRLLDPSVAGRPLTIREWREALFGDYNVAAAQDHVEKSVGRDKRRQEQAANLRSLFGRTRALPSYDAQATCTFGDLTVSSLSVSEPQVHSRIVWDAHETNWRCELLALDAYMLSTTNWPVTQRWERETLVSGVWGTGTSGLDIMSDVDHGKDSDWSDPAGMDHADSRQRAATFVKVVAAWPNAPEAIQGQESVIAALSNAEYARLLASAVAYYVRSFVATYDRLPVVPVRLQS